MSELAERLGFDPTRPVVILTSTGLGSCHASNLGVFETLGSGLATGAELLVPCPWARHAASLHRGEDIGVLLTLNAEFESLRWGPITVAPSLQDGNGGFPRTVEDTWEHADLDEVRRECRAQLERAILWGIDVSHLGSHLGVLQNRPEFFDAYMDLAVEFRLPVRLDGPDSEEAAGFPFRRLAAEEGIVFPDEVRRVRRRPAVELEQIFANLGVGVTEIVVAPAADTPELRDMDPDWAARVEGLHALGAGSTPRRVIDRTGVQLTSYRALRKLQRAGS